MSEALGSLYGTIDSYKRRLADALRNPRLAIEQAVGNANDRARNLNEMTAAAGAEGAEFGPASRRLAEAMSDAYNPAGITVWHGSPHGPFAKFDAKKIGSGEGAQAYGMGHYTAEARPTAEEYARELSAKISVDGKPLFRANKIVGSTGNSELDDYLVANLGDVKATRRKLLEDIRDVRATNKPAAKEMQQTLAALRKANVSSASDGYLYKIDLPDEHVAKMLDWDKPLHRQAPNVRKAVRSFVDESTQPGLYADWIRQRPDFRSLQNDLLENMDAAQVAEGLRTRGIPGIRYLDGQSRPGQQNISNARLAALYSKHKGDAEAAVNEFMQSVYNTPKKKEQMRASFLQQLQTPKTSNFVVFPGNEDMLQILEVNGQPIIDALRKRK